MLTPNYGCVGATYKFTCSDTVFTSLVMFFFVDNRTTISFINSFMTKTLYQAIIEIKSPFRSLKQQVRSDLEKPRPKAFSFPCSDLTCC